MAMDFKRGTTPAFEVTLTNIDTERTVVRVEFIFRQKIDEDAPELAYRIWEDLPTDTVVYENGKYYFVFTDEESRRFKARTTCYMDTRVWYENEAIPDTDIKQFMVKDTLFREVE